MKKFLTALLALVLVCACVSAYAAPIVTLEPMPIRLYYGDRKDVVSFDMNGSAGYWTAFIYQDGKWINDATGGGGYISADEASTLTHGFESYIGANGDDYRLTDNSPQVVYFTGATFDTIELAYFVTYYPAGDEPEYVLLHLDEELAKKIFDEIDLSYLVDPDGKIIPRTKTYFPHNTICVGGLEFRQEKPEIASNKWWNFAPIDLSQDGEQRFELVAGNMHVIGEVIVTVAGDDVTVNYKLYYNPTFEMEREFLTFFPALADVDNIDPDTYTGPTYNFNQPISIANDLGGDTNVLLYINNMASFYNDVSHPLWYTSYYEYFNREAPKRVPVFEAMRLLMD